MSEAFSLKQFGFKDTLGDPNQLDYTMQDVSAFSGMGTLPPMPNIYHPGTMPIHHSPQLLNMNISSYVPAASSTPTSMQLHDILDNSNEGLFKNNPNNPFFGIPSSMDWTEWNEWSQSHQGNTTWQPSS